MTTSPFVNFDDYLRLAQEVKEYRKDRLVTLDEFNQKAQQPNVVILDTRSDSMYAAKHVKGAIHLNFSDFTQDNLDRLIPDPNTVILIYCNNNFLQSHLTRIPDQYFATKMSRPVVAYIPYKRKASSKWASTRLTFDSLPEPVDVPTEQPITLALNIPTFINLYGYGRRNVYELGELVYLTDPRLQLEGTAVVPAN